MLFAVRLVDLSVIEGIDLKQGSNAELIERLRQVFDFLPKETNIDLADGIVTIDIPDSATQDKSEADRLHSKATQRAKQGDYRKAVGMRQAGYRSGESSPQKTGAQCEEISS